jgi:membrane protein required for colicin V production
MNELDIAVLAIVAVSVVAGLLKGLVREIISLAGVLFGILLALILAPALSESVARWIQHAAAAYAVAFIVVFTATLVLATLIGTILNRVIGFAHLSFLNRTLGGLFGLARGTLIGLVIVLGLTLFLDRSAPLMAESRLLPRMVWGARVMAPLLPEGPRDVLLERLDYLPSLPEDSRTI